ncbi:MAG: hypothetical protein ABR608_13910 [Pseudonocardiaceae bacterium]
MNTRLPKDDAQLLVELGAALRSAGPITNDDLARAKAAYTWRTIDEDLALAALVYDSVMQDRALIRGEAVPGARTLIFESDSMSVEVDVTADVLTGRVVPSGRADLSVMTVNGTVAETTTDDMGWFLLPAPRPGPVRLFCRTAASRLVTDWVRL